MILRIPSHFVGFWVTATLVLSSIIDRVSAPGMISALVIGGAISGYAGLALGAWNSHRLAERTRHQAREIVKRDPEAAKVVGENG